MDWLRLHWPWQEIQTITRFDVGPFSVRFGRYSVTGEKMLIGWLAIELVGEHSYHQFYAEFV